MNLATRIFLALIAPLSMTAVTVVADAQYSVVAYVPNWVDLKAFSNTIDYAKLTHINIAFENPTNAQGDLSFNKQNEFLITKAKEKGVKILISIGGGSASGDKVLLARYAQLLAEDKRAGFVVKVAEYVVAHDFDGLDVDIEGPGINKDYGAFIADLAKALKPKKKLLTAALAKGYGGNKVPDSVFEHFDFVNIMAYDGRGPWDPTSPGQHSSMELARSDVAYWLGRGLPKSKAVLGVPFYGYGFGKAFRKEAYGYAKIVAAYPRAQNTDQVGSTIWYNGVATITQKARWVVDEQLGGVMIWSLDTDASGDSSLLSAIHAAFVAKKPSTAVEKHP